MSADVASVPAIELRDVCKRFGATEIIRGVNLSISRGERHAIIGPNGAGKTTPVSYTHLTLPTILRV